MINTRFWSDNFVAHLRPQERYLFLYFLTNEHTNISGIYELAMRTIVFETRLSKEKVIASLHKLQGKVCYINGWVYIKNFQKHQTTSSEKVQAGIRAEMAKVPKEIREKIDGMDTLSDPIIYLDSDSNQYSDSPNRSEDSEWNTKFFGVIKTFQEKTGDTIKITPKERAMYPKRFRAKHSLETIEAALYWAVNLHDKDARIYYWRGKITLPNLEYKIIPAYLESVKARDGTRKLASLKAGLTERFTSKT